VSGRVLGAKLRLGGALVPQAAARSSRKRHLVGIERHPVSAKKARLVGSWSPGRPNGVIFGIFTEDHEHRTRNTRDSSTAGSPAAAWVVKVTSSAFLTGATTGATRCLAVGAMDLRGVPRPRGAAAALLVACVSLAGPQVANVREFIATVVRLCVDATDAPKQSVPPGGRLLPSSSRCARILPPPQPSQARPRATASRPAQPSQRGRAAEQPSSRAAEQPSRAGGRWGQRPPGSSRPVRPGPWRVQRDTAAQLTSGRGTSTRGAQGHGGGRGCACG